MAHSDETSVAIELVSIDSLLPSNNVGPTAIGNVAKKSSLYWLQK